MGHRKVQGSLQQLPWASDNNAAIWRLVSALEEPDNCRKLFGKSPSEVKCFYFMLGTHLVDPKPCPVTQNTSGDSKFKVYGRIAETVWPVLYQENPKAVTSRTKAKAEW